MKRRLKLIACATFILLNSAWLFAPRFDPEQRQEAVEIAATAAATAVAGIRADCTQAERAAGQATGAASAADDAARTAQAAANEAAALDKAAQSAATRARANADLAARHAQILAEATGGVKKELAGHKHEAQAAASQAGRHAEVAKAARVALPKALQEGLAGVMDAFKTAINKVDEETEKKRAAAWMKGLRAEIGVGATVTDILKEALKDMGGFVTSDQFPQFLQDNGKVLLQGAAILFALGVASFGAKKLIELAADRVRYWWKNPSLIEDTDFVPLLLRIAGIRPKEVGSMDDFVATEEFKARLMAWAEELKSLQEKCIPRGSCAMFFGPPGTGKTFVGKRIARYAGCSYVIIKGNIIAECENPIATLDRILKWAQKNHILVIIDEADALLSWHISTGKDHKVLNHFIGITGDPYNRPNMIIITNKPADIDQRFIGDGGRVDTAFKFPIPDTATIAKILENNILKMAARYAVPVEVDFMAAARGAAGECPGRDLEALASKTVIEAARKGVPLTTEALSSFAARFAQSKKEMRSFVMETPKLSGLRA